MASEWPSVRISAIASPEPGGIAIGPFGSRMKSDCYVADGVRVVRGTNLTGGRAFGDEFVFVTLEKAQSLGNSLLKPNDLVFPHRGSIGEVGIVPADAHAYVMSTSLMKLTCDSSKAYPDFVYYFFKSEGGRHALLANKSQVGTPGIGQPLTSLKSIQMTLPPLHEQRAIVSVLKGLDERVESLNQINLSSEAIARALFKSWFVDFDPVRAKAEGREPEGMDAATAAFFTDEFMESELGRIPKGWEVNHIKDVCDRIANGGTPKRSQVLYWQGGEQSWFKTGEFNDGFLFRSEEMISDLAVLESAAKIFPRYTVMMAIYGATIGKLGILAYPASFNQAATGMIAAKSVGCWFLYLSLLNGRSWFINRGNGAAQQNISKEIVESYPLTVPTDGAISSRFHDLVSPLFERIELNQELIDGLSSLRDTLLPRLISGKLRVPEAEKIVESVL